MKQFVLSTLAFLMIASCASKQDGATLFPQQIKSAYYRINNSQSYFYIEFEEALSEEIILDTVYFRSQKAVLIPINDHVYKAVFNNVPFNQDLIMSANAATEFGNTAPIIHKSKFRLHQNEAMLSYKIKNKPFYYKMINITEKQ
jgi:hypothetical protein